MFTGERSKIYLGGAFLFCFLGIMAFAWRWREVGLLALTLPPCFRIAEPQHHDFQQNCSGSYLFLGREIFYRINEAGVRDRAAKELKRGQVLVLGDSMVEGWGTSREEALPAVLEQLVGAKYGVQLVNGGLRATGTVMQSLRGMKLIEAYSPKRILWFLSENDVFDDRFAYAIASRKDQSGVPTEFSIRDFDGAKWAKHFAFLEAFFPTGHLIIRYLAYSRSVKKLLEGQADQGAPPVCAGIKRLERVARQHDIEVLYVVLPLGPYAHDAAAAESTDLLIQCIPAKRTVLDIRGALGRQKEAYFPNNSHFNPSGVRVAAGLIAQKAEWFFDLRGRGN